MIFEVKKPLLVAALDVVTPGMSATGAGLSPHYLFRVAGTESEPHIEVLTSAFRVFASCPVKDAEIKDTVKVGEAFTVEGRRLKRWLDAVGADAVLEFGLDASGTSMYAKAPEGKQKFQVLDPTKFNYWDEALVEAKVTAKIDALRLLNALEYSRKFVMDNESVAALCVVESRGGILYSTDHQVVTITKVPGLEGAKIRIHGKTAAGFLTFLATVPPGESVEVLEHPRQIMLRRADGALYGEALFLAAFPEMKVETDDDLTMTWTLNRDTMVRGINFLASGAAWEDQQLRIEPKDTGLVLSMRSMTGDMTEYAISAKDIVQGTGALPPGGFTVNSDRMLKILQSWKEPDVTFGAVVVLVGPNKTPRGFVRFRNEDAGVIYHTVHVWSR